MCLALLARTRDFHPLDCAHAGRTLKRAQTEIFPLGSFYLQNLFVSLCNNTISFILYPKDTGNAEIGVSQNTD